MSYTSQHRPENHLNPDETEFDPTDEKEWRHTPI